MLMKGDKGREGQGGRAAGSQLRRLDLLPRAWAPPQGFRWGRAALGSRRSRSTWRVNWRSRAEA